MILFQLASHQISGNQFVLILIMLLSGIITIISAYFVAKLITKDKSKIGAFMISSGFGSSALFGYPLIKMVFPDNPEAMTDAVLISEMGVGLPLFIIGPLIAKWFGNTGVKEFRISGFLISYFKSPVFFALILGIMFSFFNANFNYPVLEPVKSMQKY